MSRARILIVEDENLVALDIRQSVERLGYEVVDTVSSGERAVESAQKFLPDVVLMDIALRGEIDGIAAAALIGDNHGIPVVFLSAHADRATLERAAVAEPASFVTKPFEESQLLAALEMVLSRRLNTSRSLNGTKSASQRPLLKGLSDQGFNEIFTHHAFFSPIQEVDLASLVLGAKRVTLSAGQTLDPGEEELGEAFIVLEGRMAIIEASSDGKELIVGLVGPQDLFGLLSVLNNSVSGLVIRALRPSTLVTVPKKTLSVILQSYPHLSFRLSECLSAWLREAQILTKAIAYDDVQARIEIVLAALLPRFGEPMRPTGSVALDFSRQELASLAGTTVETVVRTLKQMERAEQVRLGKRRHIEICEPESLGRGFLSERQN